MDEADELVAGTPHQPESKDVPVGSGALENRIPAAREGRIRTQPAGDGEHGPAPGPATDGVPKSPVRLMLLERSLLRGLELHGQSLGLFPEKIDLLGSIFSGRLTGGPGRLLAQYLEEHAPEPSGRQVVLGVGVVVIPAEGLVVPGGGQPQRGGDHDTALDLI